MTQFIPHSGHTEASGTVAPETGVVYVIDRIGGIESARVIRELSGILGKPTVEVVQLTPEMLHSRSRPSCLLVREMEISSEAGTEPEVPQLPSLLKLIQESGEHVPVVIVGSTVGLDSSAKSKETLGAVTVVAAFDASVLAHHCAQALEADQIHMWCEKEWETVNQILATLTERQRVVLDSVIQGHKTKMISAKLGVSDRLVEQERSLILRRFQTTASAVVSRKMGEYKMHSLYLKKRSALNEPPNQT